MRPQTVQSDAGGAECLHTLRAFVDDPAAVQVDAVKEARTLVAACELSEAWHSQAAAEARAVYNRCIERRIARREEVRRTTAHVRALCLALIESSASTSPNTDMDRAEHARHWARTGLQFIILGELDEGERCLDASGARLRQMNEPESVEVLECELQLCGYRAHLAWTRKDLRQVLRHVEEAHALLEERGGAQFLLTASRMYLSEQVAFRLARRSFELSEAKGGADDKDATFERRELLRMLDLALSLLGDTSETGSGAIEEVRSDLSLVPLSRPTPIFSPLSRPLAGRWTSHRFATGSCGCARERRRES